MALDVLVIDDEMDIRDIISDILRDEGFSSRTSAMGTSKSSVLAAINKLNQDISGVDKAIASLRKQFSGMINP